MKSRDKIPIERTILWFHQKWHVLFCTKKWQVVAFFVVVQPESQRYRLTCISMGLSQTLNTTSCLVSSIVQFPTSLSCLNGERREEPGRSLACCTLYVDGGVVLDQRRAGYAASVAQVDDQRKVAARRVLVSGCSFMKIERVVSVETIVESFSSWWSHILALSHLSKLPAV